jgi:menaquinone-9 beta-reductase
LTTHARSVVLATGASTAVLARSGVLKHRPKAMLAARAYFEGMPRLGDRFQLRFDGVPLPGYGWVFPMPGGAANVGVGFIPRRRGPATAKAAFEHFLTMPAMRDQLAGATQVGPLKGYPIRVDFLDSPTYGPRTLLVGEAAGLVNPLTGEGIDYALESGQLAAEHLAAGLANGDIAGAEYDRLLRSRFERIFRFSEHVRDWYCVPPLLNLLVPLANRRPELRLMLTQVVLGSREPSGRGPLRMLLAMLVYLARRRFNQ